MTTVQIDEWDEPATYVVEAEGDRKAITMPRQAWREAEAIAARDDRPFELVALELARRGIQEEAGRRDAEIQRIRDSHKGEGIMGALRCFWEETALL